MPHTTEQRVDAARNKPRLHECNLPDDVRLVDMYKQQSIRGLLVRTFTLIYEGDKRIGPVTHVERYEPTIPDHIQMNWAIKALHEMVDGLKSKTAQPWNVPPPSARLARATSSFGLDISRETQRHFAQA
jgi:hypothetical protein